MKWKAFFEGLFIAICWLISAYFAYAALGPFFPPPSVIEGGRYVFLLLGVFFFVVSVAQKVEIFKFLTFESKLSQIDNKQKQQDTEIKQLQLIQATMTNTLSSVNSNSASVTFNGRVEAVERVAENLVDKKVDHPLAVNTPAKSNTIASVFSEAAVKWFLEGNNQIIRQMTPRQELLYLYSEMNLALRVSLGSNIEVYNSRKIVPKYMTNRQLWGRFLKQNEDKQPLDQSFEYFFDVGSAVANGQNVPDTDVISAITVGRALLQDMRETVKVSADAVEPKAEE